MFALVLLSTACSCSFYALLRALASALRHCRASSLHHHCCSTSLISAAIRPSNPMSGEIMKDWGLDLFDPRTAVMDSSPTGGRDTDFGFAFNDSNFSDRLLRIEIVADPPDARPESEGCSTLADWAARKSKRRRGDVVKKEDDALDIINCAEERILDSQQPDVEDGMGDDDHVKEELMLIEDSSSGDEAENNDSYQSDDGSRVLRVKTLHISSAILAAKSLFFYKLFSNGMMESEQRNVTLRITESGLSKSV